MWTPQQKVLGFVQKVKGEKKKKQKAKAVSFTLYAVSIATVVCTLGPSSGGDSHRPGAPDSLHQLLRLPWGPGSSTCRPATKQTFAVLGWPKSPFGVSRPMLWKNPNALFGQPNISIRSLAGTQKQSKVLAKTWYTAERQWCVGGRACIGPFVIRTKLGFLYLTVTPDGVGVGRTERPSVPLAVIC